MSCHRFVSPRRRSVRPSYRPTLLELEPRVLMATGVFTYKNDSAHSGLNLTESTLTPANVNPVAFGKLFTNPIDGAVFAQALYMPGVNVPNKGAMNLVFVATEHDSLYAFDADKAGAPVWKDSFINPGAGVTSVPSGEVAGGSLGPEVGITSTPVIDPATNTIYALAFTKEVTGGQVAYVERLHALDVSTGAEKFGGPVMIQVSVAGVGQGSVGGVVAFDASHQNQRPGLLLLNGVIYIASASFNDRTPYHGWVLGYDAHNLQLVSVFNTTPNGGLGGIWQSGASPAADDNGFIYVVSGNGTFDASKDYGDAVIKLSTANKKLTVVDYFAPFNQADLEAKDLDLGSAGALLLPDQPGPFPHLMIVGGKEGRIYLINRDKLGGFSPSGDAIVEEIVGAAKPLFSTPTYFNGVLYTGGIGDTLKAFKLTNGVLSKTAVSQTSTVFSYPGATPSVSANGSANGIVWVVQNSQGQAVLRAYAAGVLSKDIYNSEMVSNRDHIGITSRFVAPTIADGKVFVPTNGGINVFGLLPSDAPLPFGKNGIFVAQAYKDLLGREADPAGLVAWAGALSRGQLTRTQVALSLIQVNPAYQSQIVLQIYYKYLQTTPSSKALASWTAFLMNGGRAEQVIIALVTSLAYFQAHGATNGGFLDGLYMDVLGHGIAGGDKARLDQFLTSGMLTRAQIAAALLSSTEYRKNLVNSTYQQHLRRPADSANLNAWVAAFAAGTRTEQLAAALVGSVEYFNKLP